MLLSDKLKEIRLQSKLPQRKIAAELDIDTATYCKFEKGVMKIGRGQLLKFADFLSVNKDELLTLWLADQINNVISDDNNKIATNAIKLVYNQHNK